MESKNKFVTKKRIEQKARSVAVAKRDQYGTFSLTAQDHRDLQGTPGDNLTGENEGKAQYEVMTDGEIEKELDETVECMSDASSMGILSRQKMKLAIPFLRKVGRLPEKYQNFVTSNL